jgi:aerobic-type carbon monoxide dehydrogenase small subunit (CoxS/CutS family)
MTVGLTVNGRRVEVKAEGRERIMSILLKA